MPEIHGNVILETLKTKYGRVPILQFANKKDIQEGDILFQTANGVNHQPSILRVLEVAPDKAYFTVAHIEPDNCGPCGKVNHECRHPSVYMDGALLLTGARLCGGCNQPVTFHKATANEKVESRPGVTVTRLGGPAGWWCDPCSEKLTAHHRRLEERRMARLLRR